MQRHTPDILGLVTAVERGETRRNWSTMTALSKIYPYITSEIALVKNIAYLILRIKDLFTVYTSSSCVSVRVFVCVACVWLAMFVKHISLNIKNWITNHSCSTCLLILLYKLWLLETGLY